MIKRQSDWPIKMQLSEEKQAQLEGAMVVLKPLFAAVTLLVFALCFWWLNFGLLLSVLAAIIAYRIPCQRGPCCIFYILDEVMGD